MDGHRPLRRPASGGSDSRPTGSESDSRPTSVSDTETSISRRKALAAAGAVVAATAGCLGLRGRLATAIQSTEITTLWASDRTTEYGGNHHQFAAVDSDELTVVAPHSSLTGSDDCGIIAVDSSGELAWHSPIDPEHCTPHAVGDIGVGSRGGGIELFAGTEAGDVVGFDAETGAETLRVDALESIGFTAPVVGDFTGPNQVIATDFEGLIVAINPESDVVWSRDLDTRISVTPILTDLAGNGQQSLAVAHGRRNGSGLTVFGADGEQRWTEPFNSTPRSFTSLADGAEQLLAVGTRASARCVDATGETRWTVPLDTVVSVGDSYSDQLLVGTDDGSIRSLSVGDGSVDWKHSLTEDDEMGLNAPVVGDAFGDGSVTIAATTYTGGVVVLDTAGEILARHNHDDSIYVSPQFVDLTDDGSDDLLIMDGHGRLTALEVVEP